MNTITRFAAAALVSVGFGSAAAAHDGPYIVGSGENASVEYAAPNTNVVGGALTQTTGSGESARTQVLDVQNAQAGRTAVLVGSGENQSVIYIEQAPAPMAQAQGGAQG